MEAATFSKKIFLALLTSTFLYGCGVPKIKMSVYPDAPSITEQKERAVTAEVPQFLYDKYSSKASVAETLSSVGYPMGFANEPYGNSNTVMRLNSRHHYDRYWKISTNAPYTGVHELLRDVDNFYLKSDDITLIEIKVVGLSSHIETIGVKRFTGPVQPFNWVELFEGRIPVDEKGYLITASVSLNYLDRLDIEDGPKYFVHLPIKFLKNNDFSAKSKYSYYLFGNSKHTPFINIKINTKRPLVPHRCSIDSVMVENKKSATSPEDDGRKEFFDQCSIRLNGKLYKNFFYANPKFLEHHKLLKTPDVADQLTNQRLKHQALYSVFKNEEELRKINNNLNIARFNAEYIKGPCDARADHNKDLGNAVRTSKQRRRMLAGAQKTYRRNAAILGSAQKSLSQAIASVNRWGKSRDGINVTKGTLKNYKLMIEDLSKYLPKAEKACNNEYSSISHISGASVRKSPSFMSIMGEAIQNEYKSSYSSGSGSRSSYSGRSRKSDPISETWRRVNADLSEMYKTAIAKQNQEKEQRNKDYNAKLKQLRKQQQAKVMARKKAAAKAKSKSKYRSTGSNKSPQRQNIASTNNRSTSNRSGDISSSQSRTSTPRSQDVVSTPKKKAKKPCTGKFESVGTAPKGKCGYVYSDYTRNVRLDYNDYKLILLSNTEASAQNDLKYALRDAAVKKCKASGYEHIVHENSFAHNKFDWQSSSCKDNGKKGVFKGYRCKGSASFICTRYEGRK